MPDHLLTSPTERIDLPTRWAPTLREFSKSVSFARVVTLWREACFLSTALRAPILGTAPELPFGSTDTPTVFGTVDDNEPVVLGPITLQLGEESVEVRGYIDRLTLVGHPNRPLLRIVDYKTGRNAPDEKRGRKQLIELMEPQLVIYALAVQHALDAGLFPETMKNAMLATIGWDHLRAVDPKRRMHPARDGYLIDRATLTLLGRAIGMLVARARKGEWLLSPRSDTCPATSGWAHDYCPMVGACRLRGVESASQGSR